MSSLKISLVALVLACVCSSASAGVLYFEDFESFNAGTSLHNVAGWVGWYGDAASAASVSSKYAYSGTKSVEVDSNTDGVQVLDITEGKWVLTAMQYIPSGGTGVTRFHMQNTYGGGTIGRSVQWSFSLSDGVIGDDYDKNASATIIYDKWIELKLVIDVDNDLLEQYYNGKLLSSRAWVYSGSSQIQSIDLYGNGASSVYYDDIQIQDYVSSLVTAYDPSPEDGATDVPQDVTLAWTVGWFAQTHDVYFGASFDDVNDASRENPLDVQIGQDLAEATCDLDGLLEYGQTYYWRVDEVNAASEDGFYKGQTWSFTVEPYAYPVTPAAVTASSATDTAKAVNTINGSGMDGDTHSTELTDMWLASSNTLPAWIQYEFDSAYKLYELWVWNSNYSLESMVGYGAKDVTIEYSLDGETWTQVQGVPQFAQAAGTGYCDVSSVISLGEIVAKYVKLTIASNWGGLTGQTSLSEVRFYYVPLKARGSDPADGETGVSVGATLDWRPGREATSHMLYLDTDIAAVADGTASAETMTEHGYTPDSLDLATTYYWRVDEIGDAGAYEGDVWSFTTEEYVVVDNFESYTNDEGKAVFQTWLDKWTSAETYGGAQVGYTDPTFVETSIVHGGKQSMPLYYDNSSATFSETTMTFDASQDWTQSKIQSLTLYFYGDADNTGAGQLYVKINSTKVLYDGSTSDLQNEAWHACTIDLSSTGASLKKVTSLTIGVSGSGASGLLFIDDIGLYPAQ